MTYRPGSSFPMAEREFREGWMHAIEQLGLRARHVDMMFDKANDDWVPEPELSPALRLWRWVSCRD